MYRFVSVDRILIRFQLLLLPSCVSTFGSLFVSIFYPRSNQREREPSGIRKSHRQLVSAWRSMRCWPTAQAESRISARQTQKHVRSVKCQSRSLVLSSCVATNSGATHEEKRGKEQQKRRMRLLSSYGESEYHAIRERERIALASN